MIRRAVTRIRALVGAASRRASGITVAAETDAALLVAAAALRRLGARLTRYEAEAGMLEAKRGNDTIRLTVSAAGPERSWLRIDTDAAGARRLVRRLRAELAHPTGETTR